MHYKAALFLFVITMFFGRSIRNFFFWREPESRISSAAGNGVQGFGQTVVGLFSAIKQAKVAVSGVHLVAKRPDEVGKAITSAALVETYAIFAVLISLLLVLGAPV